MSASYAKEGSGGIPTAFENSRRRPNHYHRTGDGSLPVSKLARANTEPSRFAGGTPDRVIVLMHHEETGNSRIVRLVVRCHQLDKYGSAARSDSRSGRGPVDWRRHVFRGGACRHRHHAAHTSVGSRSRPIRRVDGLRESDRACFIAPQIYRPLSATWIPRKNSRVGRGRAVPHREVVRSAPPRLRSFHDPERTGSASASSVLVPPRQRHRAAQFQFRGGRSFGREQLTQPVCRQVTFRHDFAS